MTRVEAEYGVFLPFYAFKTRAEPASMFTHLRDTVKECEMLGYDSVWLDDHLMFGKAPILECWTTLSALASVTSKIRIGTLVTSNAFRDPGLLAKMAATADIVSTGRLEFGVGAGMQQEEHEAYGFPFFKPSARVERLRESLEIIKALWTQERTSYKGKYFQIRDAVCDPKPLQKPHPPITIGGSGEKHMLRVTAMHANCFDFGYLSTFEEYKHKVQVLRAQCEAIGRDFNVIKKSCWPAGQILIAETPEAVEEKIQKFKPEKMSQVDFQKSSFIGTPVQFKVKLQPFLDLGVTRVMLFFGDLPDLSGPRFFAEIMIEKQ